MRDLEKAIAHLREQRDTIDKKLAVLEEVQRLLAETFGAEAPPKPRKKANPKAVPKTVTPRKGVVWPQLQTSAVEVKLCKRGHPRTPENVTKGGACRKCAAAYSAQQYRDRQEAKGKTVAPPAKEPEPEPTPQAVHVVPEAPVMREAKTEPKPSTPAGPKWPKREDYKPPPRDGRFHASRGWR